MSIFHRLVLIARIALSGFAGVAVLLVCVTAAGRWSYPYELEWMEGGTLEHAVRVATGQPVYTEPTLEWTANVYAPFYYYVVAGVIQLSAPSLAAGRFVSALAWLATVVLLARATRSGPRGLGLVAAGVYASTFVWTLGWVDLVRVDSLFVLLLVAGYVRVRTARKGVHELWAALFFALAVLTKQTALVAVLPVALWVAWSRRGWRRAGLPLVFTALVLMGFLLLHAASDGWSTFYTFELPGQLRGERGLRPEFVWADLLAVIPAWIVLAVGGLWARRREDGLVRDTVILFSAVLAGWASRLDPLSYENALLPSFAVISWFAAEGAGRLFEPRTSRSVLAVGILAALIQFGTSWFDPRDHWPSEADRAAGDALVARLRLIDGPVLVPYHTRLAAQAGKQTGAHMSAMSDIMRSSDDELVRRYRSHLAERIRSGHYAAILTDGRFMLETIRSSYRDGGAVLSDPEVFVPVQGQPMRPRRIFLR